MASIADAIHADLAKRRPRVEITHPRAAAWRITYRLPIDSTEFDPQRAAMIEAVKNKKKFVYEAAVLAVLAVEIAYQGEILHDADGAPATFSSPEVTDALQATSASDAVLRLYGSDALVRAVYESLLREVGYDSTGEVIVDRGDEVDPTNAG